MAQSYLKTIIKQQIIIRFEKFMFTLLLIKSTKVDVHSFFEQLCFLISVDIPCFLLVSFSFLLMHVGNISNKLISGHCVIYLKTEGKLIALVIQSIQLTIFSLARLV